mmetsp:Transcript_16271/g.19255  ORF Transcript_16271/g.19255 Transcript_16271/m.19255 type:complete len:137 (+) Transcript_16271:260-670(+)
MSVLFICCVYVFMSSLWSLAPKRRYDQAGITPSSTPSFPSALSPLSTWVILFTVVVSCTLDGVGHSITGAGGRGMMTQRHVGQKLVRSLKKKKKQRYETGIMWIHVLTLTLSHFVSQATRCRYSFCGKRGDKATPI